MIYDEKKHYDLVYNDIQRVGRFSNFTLEYSRRQNEQLQKAANGRIMVTTNNLKEFGLACLAIAIALGVGFAMHKFLPCGKSVIFHMVAAAACMIFGVYMIKSGKNKHIYFLKDTLSDYSRGVILLVEAVLIIALWFNLPFATDWECNYFIAGTCLIAIGLNEALDFVMLITRRSRIYPVCLNAECIGYVRKRTVSSDADNHRVNWYNSPVFRYTYGGREIIAFYDVLSRGIDASLPLGPCTVDINGDEPGAIFNPTKRGYVSRVVIAAVLLFIGIILISAVLKGNVNGSGISF